MSFQIALLLIQLAIKIVDWLREWGGLEKFQQERLDAEAAELFRRTERGKKILHWVEGLPDSDLDGILRQLGEDADQHKRG